MLKWSSWKRCGGRRIKGVEDEKGGVGWRNGGERGCERWEGENRGGIGGWVGG